VVLVEQGSSGFHTLGADPGTSQLSPLPTDSSDPDAEEGEVMIMPHSHLLDFWITQRNTGYHKLDFLGYTFKNCTFFSSRTIEF
jgi:hypothetical protein